ncbi:MAG: hypothetical protein ACI9O6_002930 [Glaciecola sp.]
MCSPPYIRAQNAWYMLNEGNLCIIFESLLFFSEFNVYKANSVGLLDGLLGNASEVDVSTVAEELSPILSNSETVVQAYKMVRDLFVFTDKRLIFIDKQGVTGKKVDYLSVPYRAITQVKVETAGHFDLDCDLKIWVSGQSQPMETKLKSGLAQAVQKTLADMMFSS